ncbi:EVE domain-containing protein [Leptolyngbya sp. FACHB-261]|uniref:EVE domain-containing protein n=1 Tax=Leptolyngbya sp. FACHB-261 TaxID=2692806 RepID=UPI0016862396|nr:EVE domain-containing protein [Leptolyngbya sp. FACHB-261]MBD2103386.1 EVE domain-containing protein [Leptolyngbya sp. FACHB-261]
MKRWLLKTEPDDYNFADLLRDGRTVWDGVGNNLALKYMRLVAPGDLAFIYHTGKQKAITGIARIETEAYPDPKLADPRFVVFDITPIEALAKPVTLATFKQLPEFAEFPLVKLSRLSAMPVQEDEWQRILELAS